jgi:murein DD-endopeptidase MepM/ murein hydrolase activator NlpD
LILKISRYFLIFLIFLLANFSLADNLDFSNVDLSDNFLTVKEKASSTNLPEDFIFPLSLDIAAFKEVSADKNEKLDKNEKKKNVNSWQYVVKKGESLWQISKKFKISLNELLTANDLNDKSIVKAGDKIVIPGVKPQANIGVQNLAKEYAGKFVSALKEVSGIVIPTTGFNWGVKHNGNGTDIAAPCSSEVYAANSGTVVESSDGWNGGYGNYIIIKHSNGSYSLYGHLSLRLVSIGDTVDKGELIGYVGNTGYTVGPTGCHLHFEIRGASNPLLK